MQTLSLDAPATPRKLPENSSQVGARALPPVVDHVSVCSVMTRHMRTLHRDPLPECPVPVRTHPPICVLVGQIHAGLERCSSRERKFIAGIEQLVKPFACPRAAPRRPEFDVARLRTAFRSRPLVADRKPVQRLA